MNRGVLVLLAGIATGAATYSLLIRLHQPLETGSLDGELAWMKTELNLSDDQYARIREVHEASGAHRRALEAQVARMQDELTAFERTRRASDSVDFLEFARFVEARRAISSECLASTRDLVRAAADVMSPGQREHYFGIVARNDPQAAQPTN